MKKLIDMTVSEVMATYPNKTIRELLQQVETEYVGETARVNKRELKLEEMVAEVMIKIGIPAHIKGYGYLKKGIILATENPEILEEITKTFYPAVAKEFKTTASRAERAMRYAIEVAWDRGDVDVLSNYFGYTVQASRGRPTNSKFVAIISDKLRFHLKKEGKI